MLDYLAMICLLALCAGHYILIQGCFKINHAITEETTGLDSRLAEMNNLLNEACEVLVELADGKPQNNSIQPTGGSIQEMLTAFLMNKMSMSQNHASETQEQREIHEIDQTETQNSEEIQHQQYSTESVSA